MAIEIIVPSFFCFQCIWNICYFPGRNLVSSYVITDLVSLTTVQEEYKKRNLLNDLYTYMILTPTTTKEITEIIKSLK